MGKINKEDLLILKGKAVELREFCHKYIENLEKIDIKSDCLKSCPLRDICDDDRIHDLIYDFEFKRNMKDKVKIEKAYKILDNMRENK